jgi:hypothetical protein
MSQEEDAKRVAYNYETHTFTIDGNPLTRMDDNPGTHSRYAEETRLMRAWWKRAEDRQAAFMGMLKSSMGR